MRANDEEFLRYYWEELLYLRRVGQSFARTYPKVASRLELQGDESPDPHVERLIESFAFLTARIQRRLDEDFPEIATQVLNILYPHFLLPIPSMAIARFDVDPTRGNLTAGYTIPRHTKLFAQAAGKGAVCRWRTSSDMTLWPVEVTEAAFESADDYPFVASVEAASVLRLRLVSRTVPFDKLELDRLRFHLSGDAVIVPRLYDLLLDTAARPARVRDTTPRVAVMWNGGQRHRFLPPASVTAVGFEEDEAILPYPIHSHPSYRLMQEYFTFPEKFHFFDVANLRGCGVTKSICCSCSIARRRAFTSRPRTSSSAARRS
jgi:type VI secretion system protein ImpG